MRNFGTFLPNCQFNLMDGGYVIVYDGPSPMVINSRTITIHLVREKIEPPKDGYELYECIKNMIYLKSESSQYVNESYKTKEALDNFYSEFKEYYDMEADILRRDYKDASSKALRQIKEYK
jgi:hypothetical protein